MINYDYKFLFDLFFLLNEGKINASNMSFDEIIGNFSSYVNNALTFVNSSFQCIKQNKNTSNIIIDSGLSFIDKTNIERKICFAIGFSFVNTSNEYMGFGGLHIIDKHKSEFLNMLENLPPKILDIINKYSSSFKFDEIDKENMFKVLLVFPFALKYGAQQVIKELEKINILYRNNFFCLKTEINNNKCTLITMYYPSYSVRNKFKNKKNKSVNSRACPIFWMAYLCFSFN